MPSIYRTRRRSRPHSFNSAATRYHYGFAVTRQCAQSAISRTLTRMRTVPTGPRLTIRSNRRYRHAICNGTTRSLLHVSDVHCQCRPTADGPHPCILRSRQRATKGGRQGLVPQLTLVCAAAGAVHGSEGGPKEGGMSLSCRMHSSVVSCCTLSLLRSDGAVQLCSPLHLTPLRPGTQSLSTW